MTKPDSPPRPQSSVHVGLPQRLLGMLLVTHPIPSLMYVTAVALFSVLAAYSSGHAIIPATLARVLVGVACAQVAIGTLNDYMDRELDAQSGRSKPLVMGLITPRMALGQVICATILLLLLFMPLGWVALLLGMLIEGLGLAYDLGLKSTPFSGLLYAIYFPLIPLLAWVVFGSYQPFLWWVLPFGAALGLAMNIANTLPDLESDTEAGVRGLPHLLGLRNGLAVVWITPPAVYLVMALLDLFGIVPAQPLGLALAGVAATLPVAIAAFLYFRRPEAHTLRITFYIQAAGVLAMAAAWFFAVAL
ncbi:MAG TPA: UbiA family prenyltransferase [Ktedonobacterales bacterium]|jgi:4-hydroxybenzoate polyprenyltransferase|nr:UbiA family prenyltransferase [Ktedonobacterales bacterium]